MFQSRKEVLKKRMGMLKRKMIRMQKFKGSLCRTTVSPELSGNLE